MRTLFLVLTACSTQVEDRAPAPVQAPPLHDAAQIVELSNPRSLDRDEDPEPVEEPPPVGFGNIIVTELVGNAWGVDLRAGFTRARLPYVNWVECTMGFGLCIEAPPILPDVPVDVPGHLSWESLPTVQRIGGNLRVGPYVTNGYVSQDGHYWGEGDDWAEGPLDVSWSAGPEWPAFSGSGVFEMAEHLQGVEPASFTDHVVEQDGVFELTWTPGTDPLQLDVVAERPGGTQVRRTYALVDDGHFALDIAELGLHPDDREVNVALARVRYSSIDVEGNPVSLVSRSEASYRLYVTDSRRTLVVPGSSYASDAPVLGSGSYHGELVSDGYLAPAVDCTRFTISGDEAVVAVDLEAGERLVASGSIAFDTYNLVYIKDDPGVSPTCLAGAYREESQVAHINEGEQTERVYVVVGASRFGSWFELDLDIHPAPQVTTLSTSCEAAATGASVSGVVTGSYAEAMAANPDEDVALFLPVSIAPGQHLVVTPTAEVGGLRLLDSCDPGAPSLATNFRDGSLAWTHRGSTPIQAVLEVASPRHEQQPTTFDVDIDLYTPTELAVVDTCADLANADVLTTGLYRSAGSTIPFDDDVDLADPGPSCTTEATDGADGMVVVELQPGETLDVRYLLENSVGAVYLLDQCGDASTVLSCGYQPKYSNQKPPASTLTWTNDSVDVETVFLGLDSFANGGFAGLYSLDVHIHGSPSSF